MRMLLACRSAPVAIAAKWFIAPSNEVIASHSGIESTRLGQMGTAQCQIVSKHWIPGQNEKLYIIPLPLPE